MKNFKRILASIGMLTVAIPTALSVAACSNSTTSKYSVSKIATLDYGINELVQVTDGDLYAITFNGSEDFNFSKINLTDNKTEKLGTSPAGFNGTLMTAAGNLYGIQSGSGVTGQTLVKFDLKNNHPENVYSFVEDENTNIVTINTLVQFSNGKLYATGIKSCVNGEDREYKAVIWEINLTEDGVTVEEKSTIKIEVGDEQFPENQITNLIEISDGKMCAIFGHGDIYNITLGEEPESIYAPTPEKPVQSTKTIKTSNGIIIDIVYKDGSNSVYKLNFDSEQKLEKLFDVASNKALISNLFEIDNKLYTVTIAGDVDLANVSYKIYEYDLVNKKLISENDLTFENNKEIVPVFTLGDKKLYAGSMSGKIYKISI